MDVISSFYSLASPAFMYSIHFSAFLIFDWKTLFCWRDDKMSPCVMWCTGWFYCAFQRLFRLPFPASSNLVIDGFFKGVGLVGWLLTHSITQSWFWFSFKRKRRFLCWFLLSLGVCMFRDDALKILIFALKSVILGSLNKPRLDLLDSGYLSYK